MNAGAVALENLRRSNGWTQRELAMHLGLDEPLVSRLLRGIRRPNLEQATQIETRTGLRPALWTQGREAEPEPEPANDSDEPSDADAASEPKSSPVATTKASGSAA